MSNISRTTIERLNPYKDEIYDLYWNWEMSFKEISELLGVGSPIMIYRYMKKCSKVRTKRGTITTVKRKKYRQS